MLTIYTYIPRGASASFYYRLQVPIYTAHALGLPVRAHIDTNDSAVDPENRARAYCESDIVMLYQPIGDETFQNARRAKGFVPSKRDGGWKYPPTIVVETDDNLFNVTPFNQAYRHLGHRDHEGKELPAGHMIGTLNNGEKKILWKDGENGFDITRNRQTVQSYRNMIEIADMVSCSTPHVAECVKADSRPRRVQVFPNLVRFDHYEQVRLAEEPEKVKILWQGGASHYEDWYPLREQLGRITKKYPQVEWLIWGQLYHWVTELIPPDRYRFIDWCPYHEYKLRLVTMGHDINLAPLADNRFNRCRSAIKFYEGSVLRKPAATLAQATGPYRDEIVDRQTGLLFKDPEEFEQRLSELIEDVTLRKTLASNAKDWVSENRDAFKHVPKQFAALEQLREQIKTDQPHMPEDEWTRFEQRIAEEEAKAQEPVEA